MLHKLPLPLLGESASEGSEERSTEKAPKKRKKRQMRSSHTPMYFRSTIISWGVSSGYANAKPAVTLTKSEEKLLKRPGFVRESPRNRNRRRAEKRARSWKNAKQTLPPIRNAPTPDPLELEEDLVGKNLTTAEKITPRRLRPLPLTDETKDPFTDAQLFASIADNLGNAPEGPRPADDCIIQIADTLGEIVDVSELKMMQNILAKKIEDDTLNITANDEPCDARIGELQLDDEPSPSLHAYRFQDKNAVDVQIYFESEVGSAATKSAPLLAGQRCEVFKPAHGQDWWPTRILAVSPNGDSNSAATYTVEFLSGYYLGDVDTDVQRCSIDVNRRGKDWVSEWRRQVGQSLFKLPEKAGTDAHVAVNRRRKDWVGEWWCQIGQDLFKLPGKAGTDTYVDTNPHGKDQVHE